MKWNVALIKITKQSKIIRHSIKEYLINSKENIIDKQIRNKAYCFAGMFVKQALS